VANSTIQTVAFKLMTMDKRKQTLPLTSEKLPMSPYQLGMGGNLTIGMAGDSHGFSLSWDPLLS
jgi:hypothetical protein